MFKLLLVGVILVGSAVAASDIRRPRCPNGWYTFRGTQSCYKVITPKTKSSWIQGRQACLAIGGDLVKIDSTQENEYVAFLARTFSTSHYVLIGAHRDRLNKLLWVDGSVVRHSYWNKGEPNNLKGERCVMMYAHPPHILGLWNDLGCDTHYHSSYVCEM